MVLKDKNKRTKNRRYMKTNAERKNEIIMLKLKRDRNETI